MKSEISWKFQWIEALLIRGLTATCVAILAVRVAQALAS